MDNEKWECKAALGFGDFIAPLIALAVFGGVELWLFCTHNNAYILTLPLAAVAVLINALTVYRALSDKLFIGQNGFYHQTKPGNGRYYAYAEIREAKRSRNTRGFEQCVYKTVDGTVVKFKIDNINWDAVECLLVHINGETEDEDE